MQGLLERIDSTFLQVEDMERACQWYHDTLGFPILWRTDIIIALKVGDKTPLTLVKKGTVPANHPPFHFFTSNIEKVRDAMIENNIQVEEIRDYGTVQLLDFIDSEGNHLHVCQYEMG
ncbi:VOC family protein [Longirhabdus pacifica]|uniref:VOC family protein n=1 Tax=Longirhabdus pacifica TaxID=2305227 RepID=UPI0013E8CBFA|nr:VOC family protein [Longirhabdus pacifica]